MRRTSDHELVLVSPLTAHTTPRGEVVLTRKFVDGATAYAERWPGPMRVLVAPAREPGTNLDHAPYRPSELPFTVEVVPFDPATLARRITGAAMVAGALVHEQTELAGLAQRIGVPLVYTTEYSLRTREQMVHAETRNPLLRLRRIAWQRRTERRFERAIARAVGLQCNGTPTHDAYRSLNARALLFFDTRVSRALLCDPEILRLRSRELLAGEPLRLVFSGRLVAIKGPDHVIEVAAELRRMGVPFTLDVFGGGALESVLSRRIAERGLWASVRLGGVRHFERELLPHVRRHADLFVCCHRQGDPSCTYLETMACGTPIAGYDNEAFAGIVRESGAGWLSPMDRPRALAARIAALHRHRRELVGAAERSLRFASRHTFEESVRRRMDHLFACVEAHRARSGSGGSPARTPRWQ